jgi:alkylation response protein AidB-like acyl-CoA dehydrogenase
MNFELHHPSTVLDKQLVSTIRSHAREAERLGSLHPDQLGIIYQHNWFTLFVPKAYGGAGLSLPEILKLEECLSWADGSLGWVVTLCSGAGWFAGFLDPKIAAAVFTGNTVCVAGSGALTGTAAITENGYELNGVWKYASGAVHATAFTMNCYITKDNKQVYDPDGSPAQSSFIVKRDDVKLLKTWNSMGMIATGSHSFEVNNVKVPVSQGFNLTPNCVVLKDSVYRYPFLQLAETTLAVNLSGMAVRFIDVAEIILGKNKSKYANSIDTGRLLAESKTAINASRQLFFTVAEASWNELLSTNELSLATRSAITEVSQNLVLTSRTLINKIYPHCGLVAADTAEEINLIWRNFHTAGQHMLFRRG